MKTYEEMAKSVLSRVEEYESEKQTKRRRIRKLSLTAAPVLAAAVIAAVVLNGGSIKAGNDIAATESRSEVSEASGITASDTASNDAGRETGSDGTSKKETRSDGEASKNKTGSDGTKKDSESPESGSEISSVRSDTESGKESSAEVAEDNSGGDTGTDTQTVSPSESKADSRSEGDEEELPSDFEPEPGSEGVDDVIGIIYKDDLMYMQFSVYDDGFTLDENIGRACEFEGTYKSYFNDTEAEVYTVKESPDVLIVKLSNGGTVALGKAGQLIINGRPYCSTLLDTDVYLADSFIGHVSDFETVNVPYLTYDVELSPNDEVYSVIDKDEQTLCIKQENGNTVIFVSMW